MSTRINANGKRTWQREKVVPNKKEKKDRYEKNYETCNNRPSGGTVGSFGSDQPHVLLAKARVMME